MEKQLISMIDIKKIAEEYIKPTKKINTETKGKAKKELPPQYSLLNMEFNSNSRIAHIEILQTKKYRTIQKYITEDYTKHPVYSKWKVKERLIKKTIKLTNSELELLNIHEDDLIKLFSEEIVINLNSEDLLPSWFIKLYLKREFNSNIKVIQDELDLFVKQEENKIVDMQENIIIFNDDNTHLKDMLIEQNKIKNDLVVKISKLNNLKPNILKAIFSFGIYNYLISDKRKNNIVSELEKVENLINKLNDSITQNNNKIEKCKISINHYKSNITLKEQEQKNKESVILNEYYNKISQIKPLSNTFVQDNSFTMLKFFSGLEYEKIIGVYIIRNKEKDKYYVGQSKDVMKRIKQHFNGTIPKNSIFAEDYYTSNIDSRENLFEIKIIRCETKDELDKLEKNLIYEYDSWNNGYNGTSGNI